MRTAEGAGPSAGALWEDLPVGTGGSAACAGGAGTSSTAPGVKASRPPGTWARKRTAGSACPALGSKASGNWPKCGAAGREPPTGVATGAAATSPVAPNEPGSSSPSITNSSPRRTVSIRIRDSPVLIRGTGHRRYRAVAAGAHQPALLAVTRIRPPAAHSLDQRLLTLGADLTHGPGRETGPSTRRPTDYGMGKY